MTARSVFVAMIGLGVCGVLTLGALPDDRHEEEVTLDQVPAAVKATILKEAAGAKVTEIERETKNGTTVYEAEFVLNGREIEIKIAPDGTLLGRETEDEDDDDDDLTIDQVPAQARAALRKLAGDAKIVKVERERANGVLVYEAEWVTNGTKHDAAVLDDGTLLETAEVIPVEQAPAGVRTAILKRFGDAKVVVEMKMIVIYEAEARIDGKEVELLVLPTGRVIEDPSGDDDGDDDDDDD